MPEDTAQPNQTNELSVNTEGVEKKPTLLQQVRERLQADKRVHFAGEILQSSHEFEWLETVNIIVAPNKPIYDVDKLNRFMHSLVPNIPRSNCDDAIKYDKQSNFRLGILYFDETVGEITRNISSITTAVDPAALERAGIHIGESQKTETDTLERRTWVRVYPDVRSAQIVADYEQGVKDGTVDPNQTFSSMQHEFSPKQFEILEKSGKNPLFRRPKLLGGKG